MKFSHKSYVIVLTAGSDEGTVATIKVEAPSSSIFYSISGAGSLLDIDNSGKLKLMKKLDNKIAGALNNTKITVVASNQGTWKKTSTTVSIIILPLYFGDQYIHEVSMVKDSIVKENPRSVERITPLALLRFLRRPSQTAKRIAMAQLKVETKILEIKKMILQIIGKLYGDRKHRAKRTRYVSS